MCDIIYKINFHNVLILLCNLVEEAKHNNHSTHYLHILLENVQKRSVLGYFLC